MHRRAPDSGMRNPPVSRAGSRLEMVFPAPSMMLRPIGAAVKSALMTAAGRTPAPGDVLVGHARKETPPAAKGDGALSWPLLAA